MATSGSAAFDMDFLSIVEEAFERCGAEVRTGYDLRTARRSLNLLLIEWANRGTNLWTIEQGTIALREGVGVYPLPADTVDLLDHVLRQTMGSGESDTILTRVPFSTYVAVPNKATKGRPTQLWVDRRSGATSGFSLYLDDDVGEDDTYLPVTGTDSLSSQGFIRVGSELVHYSGVRPHALVGCVRGHGGTQPEAHSSSDQVTSVDLPAIYLWNVPDRQHDGAQLVYWRMKRMDDTGHGGVTSPVPFRFLPSLVAGLAYYLSTKITGTPPDRTMMLKQDYEEQWAMASTEDREKVPWFIVPAGYR